MIVVDGVGYDELSSDPASPAEGQTWYNTTEKKLKLRRNGATVNIAVGVVDSVNQFTGSVTLVAGPNITINSGSNQIVISGSAGSGEANTASNVGTGTGLFTTKSGVNLPFKSLLAGPGVTVTSDTNEVVISGSAGGGSSVWAVSGTTTLTTTSSSFIQLGNMTITPGAGTYMAMFCTSTDNSSNNGNATFAIQVNGATLDSSTRLWRRGAGQGDVQNPIAVSIVAKNVGAGQAVRVVWSSPGSSTQSVYERIFILTKIGTLN